MKEDIPGLCVGFERLLRLQVSVYEILQNVESYFKIRCFVPEAANDFDCITVDLCYDLDLGISPRYIVLVDIYGANPEVYRCSMMFAETFPNSEEAVPDAEVATRNANMVSVRGIAPDVGDGRIIT